MQKLFIFFYFFLILFQSTEAQSVNALALKQGAKIISFPESYGQSSRGTMIRDWSPEAIVDETNRGWCSANGNFPLTFVFELSEEYNIDKLGFDNLCQKEYAGICTKDIKIEVSAVDAYSGYKEIGLVQLEQYVKKYYPVKVIKGRWMRFTILSNHGNASYTELMDIEVWGKPLAAASLNLVGLWNSTYGALSFNKNKNGYIYGCYEGHGGQIHSLTIQHKTITYRWEEVATNMKGWAIVTAGKDGNKMSGIWGYNDDHNNIGTWEFERIGNTPNVCPNDAAMANSVNTPAATGGNKNYLKPQEEALVQEEIKKTVTEKKGDVVVQENKVVTTPSNNVDFDPATAGKNILFIIAINDYKYWNKLTNAKKDAQDVKQVLTSRYGFLKENIYEIYDGEANSVNIFAKITEMKKHVTANDNLLIYFSGHGFYNPEIEEGFWIPVDAKKGSEPEYIPNSTLLKYVKSIPAKHIFLVADACFSGSLLSQTSRGYVENVEQYKSRWALTSGRLEFVSDGDAGVNSPFANYFIKFLKENKKAKVPVTELIQYVKVAVSNNSDQTPMGNPLKNVGDEGGEFVFYLKE